MNNTRFFLYTVDGYQEEIHPTGFHDDGSPEAQVFYDKIGCDLIEYVPEGWVRGLSLTLQLDDGWYRGTIQNIIVDEEGKRAGNYANPLSYLTIQNYPTHFAIDPHTVLYGNAVIEIGKIVPLELV